MPDRFYPIILPSKEWQNIQSFDISRGKHTINRPEIAINDNASYCSIFMFFT